ncbi:hypothetical protein P152DRAFT_242929 [Eremomyces bilateralis CBS 781.70]|uniref:Uncharacterized protein n=1 Tax=Eremomyces bilateralis CBS 781.70 TaxID=1392243 RepID=A0A6G1GAJ5_9PEZI|nr:uncharacterized protein P152DRAFT_242929 [Eremomyces bilateralis CBS 781.70]KAF1815032.1 hypothetical protein P152DRAFT_242929 [Eremomyces bilateralis CBS 781.70]
MSTSKPTWVHSIDCSAGPLTSQKPRQYRPAILRLPSLIVVGFFAAASVGLLEYAVRELPTARKGYSMELNLDVVIRRQANETDPPTSTIDYTTDPGAYVPLSTTRQTAPGAYVPLSTTTQTAPGAYVPLLSSVTFPAMPSGAYVPTVSTTGSTLSTFQTTVWSTTTDTLGRTSSVLASKIITTAIPLTTTLVAENPHGQATWPAWRIFVGNYLPVFIATIFEIVWTAIFAKVKLITPFIALAAGRGAVLKDTLIPYFVSTNLMPLSILSLFKGNWIMLSTSIAYTVVSLLPALASESIFLNTHYDCPIPNLEHGGVNPCWPPRLSAEPVIIRIIQSLLTFIAVMTLLIALLVKRAKTGLYNDSSTIASIASLAHHPSLLTDFRGLDPEATDRELDKQLGRRRYALRDYQTQEGTWRYGIVPIDESGRPTLIPQSAYGQPLYGQHGQQSYYYQNTPQYTPVPIYPSMDTPAFTPVKRKSRVFQNFMDAAFILFLLGCLGLIVAYFKEGSDSDFNRFFNSNRFGPRFVMTVVGTLIAGHWKRLHRRVQSVSAFRELCSTPPPAAKQSILIRSHAIHVTSIFPQLFSHHFFPAFISFVSLLADMLVILLSSIPFAPGQVFQELLACTYSSIGILSVMVLAVLGMFLWYRQVPYLPRNPSNVAGIMSYLTNDSLSNEMEGLEVRSTQDRDQLVASWSKSYYYGKSRCSDGIERWTVTGVN